MATRIEELKKFLTDNSKDAALVPPAIPLLQPFFDFNPFLLSAPKKVDCRAIGEAISLAIGRPVVKVILISNSAPFEKPSWMTEEVHENSLGKSLGSDLCDILTLHRRFISLEEALAYRLGPILGDKLARSLGDSILRVDVENLVSYIEKVYHRNKHWYTLKRSVNSSLSCFLGSVLVGNREMMDPLTPLIRQLHHVIPLGEKGDEPGVWLVRCGN